jgi:hypothetical protein
VALEGVEKVAALKGRDFSRVESSMISTVASATEGMFLEPLHFFSTLFSP